MRTRLLLSVFSSMVHLLMGVFFVKICLVEFEKASSSKRVITGSLTVKWKDHRPIIHLKKFKYYNIVSVDHLKVDIFRGRFIALNAKFLNVFFDEFKVSKRIRQMLNYKRHYEFNKIDINTRLNIIRFKVDKDLYFILVERKNYSDIVWKFESRVFGMIGRYSQDKLKAFYTRMFDVKHVKGIINAHFNSFQLQIKDKEIEIDSNSKFTKCNLAIDAHHVKKFFDKQDFDFKLRSVMRISHEDLRSVDVRLLLKDLQYEKLKIKQVHLNTHLNLIDKIYHVNYLRLKGKYKQKDIAIFRAKGDIKAADLLSAQTILKRFDALKFSLYGQWDKKRFSFNKRNNLSVMYDQGQLILERGDNGILKVSKFISPVPQVVHFSGQIDGLKNTLDLKAILANKQRVNLKGALENLKIDIVNHGVISIVSQDGLTSINLADVAFFLPANLGEKKKQEKFEATVHWSERLIDIESQHCTGIFKYGYHLEGFLQVNNKTNDLDLHVRYDGGLRVRGKGRFLDVQPWLETKNDNKPNQLSMDIELQVQKLRINDSGWLDDALINVQNEFGFSDIYIVGDAKHNEKEEKNLSHAPIYICISGLPPKRELLIFSDYGRQVTLTLGVSLPILTARVLVKGLFSEEGVMGEALIEELYTKQDLGILNLIQFLSVGNWLNHLIQFKANYWSELKAKWHFTNQDTLEINKIRMSNAHYAFKARGVVDFESKQVAFHGSIVPKTLMQRLIFSPLGAKLGIEFDIFGPFDNVQTAVKNKAQVVPFFIP